MPASIGFLTFPDFQVQDLAGPLSVFELANSLLDKPAYELSIVSKKGGLVKSSTTFEIMSNAVPERPFDTLIVVGGEGCCPPRAIGDLVSVVSRHFSAGRRISSICTGAFVLAEAGVLHGCAATIHWKCVQTLQQLYPDISVETDRIFVRSGTVWTSAGVLAGIDLALALVEEDLGPTLARSVAREMVMYYRRPGVEKQRSTLLEVEASSDRIRAAINYVRENLCSSLSVESLAEIACLSTRQFSRLFVKETGETPARTIEKIRSEVALSLIRDSHEPLGKIAARVGFASPRQMHRAFVRLYGDPPQKFRWQ